MWWRRTLEIAGDLFIGDGVASVLVPQAHMRLWQRAMPWGGWQRCVAWFAARPGITRLVGSAQIVIGGWMVVAASRDLQ